LLRTPFQAQRDAHGSKLAVEYFRWWETFGLIVALPRELRRDPALLRDGFQVLRRYRPTGFVNSLVNLWAVIFAVCRAEQFRRTGVRHVHGAWASGPATAAAVLGRLCGISFSFAGHAYDIYEHDGDRFLEPKLRAASFVHTTTEANVTYLRERVPEAHILFARNGLEQLPTAKVRSRVPGPIRLLSVARLVPKKGHCHQLAACALLKQWRVPFEARIVGTGELHRHLQRQIDALNLADVVTLCGGQPHAQAQESFAWADVFWHTGIIDAKGNRDGLPNVIPEAFAHQVPVISSPEPGATEAVTNEVTGLVVDVTDHTALAKAVKRLAEDESLRQRLGENGRRWVEESFLIRKNAAILAEAFREILSAHEKKLLTVAYIFEYHPNLAQTFLKREITELMRQGLRVEVHSLWRVRLKAPPSEPGASPFPEFDKLTIHYFHWWEAFGLVVALPRELRHDPALLRNGWRMLWRYRPVEFGNTMVNIWGAIFAVCRAREFRQHRPDAIHGVWATGAATAAAILSRLCGIPYSVGTDGYDVYEHGGDQFLEPKLRNASFVQANFQANVAYLHQRVPEAHVVLARRGLDRPPSIANRTRAPGPLRILSVGRLVSKKGHRHQLDACALLKRWEVPFEVRIIGDGALRRELQRQINLLGLADVVTLCGGQQHECVQEAYDWADIFWHTGIIDVHGNRDGLPNVIPEAFAHRLPVICGPVAGATEVVTNEVTGLVVDVSDPVALAGAVKRLAEDEPLRQHLGENGRRWVEENFLVSKNTAILAEAFREAAGNECHDR
jgi:glycosyltransferase involved in cell wall biosynthesis